MKRLLGVLLLLTTFPSVAQDQSTTSVFMDLTAGIGASERSASASYQFAWKFGKHQRLELGTGARMNALFSNNAYYVTAPAKLVKGESGPAALFNDKIPANMDSVHFPSGRIGALNILLSIGYRFSDRWRAGFNIDVIGFSFGRDQLGTYINGSFSQQVMASPSGFNLLLVGENDLGSLNSEFFAAYRIKNKLWVKAGIQHIFMEYTTSTKAQQLPEPNDRFRITPTIFCFGVIYAMK
ncbi:MAG: hypothetical protein JNK10_14585 [Cyclobacteriaceae bacterium]|nr:hypothetical protein [Cyclobacteriaceae bacterium]